MIFNKTFFKALNDWQKGWREDQQRRIELAGILKAECESLPSKYKQVDKDCFRKRFLNKGEMVDIILKDEKKEGITSWTTDIRFAEIFKEKFHDGAVTAAIFECNPDQDEIVLNIAKLWECSDFNRELIEYQKESPENCQAIFNFKDKQREVILEIPLRGSDIIALTGISSPFDDLCDHLKIPEEDRMELINKLIDNGTYPESVSYIKGDKAKRAVSNTIRKFYEMINKLKPS